MSLEVCNVIALTIPKVLKAIAFGRAEKLRQTKPRQAGWVNFFINLGMVVTRGHIRKRDTSKNLTLLAYFLSTPSSGEVCAVAEGIPTVCDSTAERTWFHRVSTCFSDRSLF
jgi:hypothetical protein